MNRFLAQKTFFKLGKVAFSTTKPVSNVFPGAFLSRDNVTARVVDVIQSFNMTRPGAVNINTNFVTELGMDSLLRKELNAELAREFCVPQIPTEIEDSLVSVKDAVDFFSTHPKAR